MKLTIHRNDLKSAVSAAAAAVNGKSPLPILGHLLLRAHEGTLRVSATDLEIAIEREVSANVIDSGGCTVPAKLLGEVADQLQDDEVTLQLDGPRLTVKTRSSKFRLNTLSADEFPILAAPPDESDVMMDIDTFQAALGHVKACVAPPAETRAILTGVLFELDAKLFSATSSDGRRLAHIDHARDGKVRGARSMRVVVTSSALSALSSLVGHANGEMSISMVHGQIWFGLGGTTLMARSIEEGKFPDYQSITPQSFERKVWVHRKTLASALRRAMIVSRRDEERPSLLRLDFESDQLRVTSNTPDTGDAEETVPIRLEGDPLKMGINGRYLLDAVVNAGGEELTIHLNDALSPLLVRPVGNDDLFYLVTPVRIKEAI